MQTSREVHLVRRPAGPPTGADFAVKTVEVGPPGDGEVRVRNLAMSVDPYMRGLMDEAPTYGRPYELHAPMHGPAIGEVTDSGEPTLPVGSIVRSHLGWREAFTVRARAVQPVEHADFAASAHLGVLGIPGLTAYIAAHEVGGVAAGETVLVSAAAGAVGVIAGQLAVAAGARAVALARGNERAAALRDLGYAAVIDPDRPDATEGLATATGDGVDLYVDLVGTPVLAVALGVMRTFGRIVSCGSVPQFNRQIPIAAVDLFPIVARRLTVTGFLHSDYAEQAPAFRDKLAHLLSTGKVKTVETTEHGIERAVPALLRVLNGGTHLGKMVVDLSDTQERPAIAGRPER